MNSSKVEEPLTADGRLKADPVFVNAQVVFTAQLSPTLLALMRLTPGKVAERLHPEAITSEFEPSFSSGGASCAFVRSQGNLNLKLVIRDVKSGRESVFDPGGGFAGVRRPSLAPDGSRIAFGLPGPGGQAIASVNGQGKDRQILTQGGINNWPAFSPDGKQIAFCSSRAGTFDLYLMMADGGDVRRLTRLGSLVCRPAWSPDGKRLAFSSMKGGNWNIYVVGANGTALVQVTHGRERTDYPTWHPDGERLAFVGERAGKFDLYLARVPA